MVCLVVYGATERGIVAHSHIPVTKLAVEERRLLGRHSLATHLAVWHVDGTCPAAHVPLGEGL